MWTGVQPHGSPEVVKVVVAIPTRSRQFGGRSAVTGSIPAARALAFVACWARAMLISMEKVSELVRQVGVKFVEDSVHSHPAFGSRSIGLHGREDALI